MTEWKPLLEMQEALESAPTPNPVTQSAAQSNPAPPSHISMFNSVVLPTGTSPSQPVPSSSVSGATNASSSFRYASTTATQTTEVGWPQAGALLLLVVLLVGVLVWQNPPPAGPPTEKDAYTAACNFMRQQYPGAKEFSSFQDSNVRPTYEAGVFQVEVIVTGVNAFNAPVRNRMIVDVKLQDNKWVYQDHMLKN